jgi:hypothetical protein
MSTRTFVFALILTEGLIACDVGRASGRLIQLGPKSIESGITVKTKNASSNIVHFTVIITPKVAQSPADWRGNLQVSTGKHPVANCEIYQQRYSALFSIYDFTNLRGFVEQLKRRSDPVSSFVWNGLSAQTRQALTDSNLSQDNISALIADLNTILRINGVFHESNLTGVALSAETEALRKTRPVGGDVIRLNRLLLENAFPRHIVASRAKLPDALKDSDDVHKYESTVFEFAVSRAYLDSSTFWMTYTFPEVPSYVSYWFYLRDMLASR